MALPPLSLSAWLRYDVVEPLLDGLVDVHSLLEIGAGGGGLGARLAERYAYVGLEPDEHSFMKARARLDRAPGAEVLKGSIELLEPGRTFDLVCAFEVLEHIEDDAAALREWCLHVRPGGWLLVSVPAWRNRWGPSDRRVGHYRRYDPSDLEALVVAAGFRGPRLFLYGFPLGNLLQFGWNLLARRAPGEESIAERTATSGRWLQPADLLGPLTQAVAWPFRLLQRPFARRGLGTGLVCLARQNGDAPG